MNKSKMATDELLQLQQLSGGIKPDLEPEPWHMCYYSETAGNARNEEYYFPCSNDKQCCGRECCTMVSGGFPLWLLILLVVLGFFLLFVLTLCIFYYCWKYCWQKKKASTPPPRKLTPIVIQKTAPPPPPKVEMYKRTPLISGGTLRRISDDNLIEIKTTQPGSTYSNTVNSYNSSPTSPYYYNGHQHPSTATRPKNLHTTTTTIASVASNGIGGNVSPNRRPRRAQAFRNHQQHSTATDSSPGDELIIGQRNSDTLLDQHRFSLMTTPTSTNTASERERESTSFVPSPMEETFESAPRPIHIQHHDEREITQEKRPLLSNVETPREQKARMEYLRSGERV